MLPLQSTVVVSKDLREFFTSAADAGGHGGWQSLMRRLRRDLEHSDTLTLTSVDLKRLVRYAGNYGSGGYQRRLRQLLQLWADQHHLPPKKKRKLSADERLVVQALRPAPVGNFTRTHYAIIGQVIAEEMSTIGRQAATRLCARFSTIFAADSPRFDARRWEILCGLREA